jgi:putative transposase
MALESVGKNTSQTFTGWCKAQDIELRVIQPRKLDQNAYIERFNRTYREEVLSGYLGGRRSSSDHDRLA